VGGVKNGAGVGCNAIVCQRGMGMLMREGDKKGLKIHWDPEPVESAYSLIKP